ncbi:E3 ubiquitin-protein ligase ORTHRUS 2-like isoform X2 [Dioscorea cayenensis subsp. rotundata]|uniref:RING-type E3 ubiquitin transferase n=1 Tax=Dioscorea cayennensis subsp. rotundata TaxID=55577 RepID=A0AB40B951_DIOCR|nr:E3 ubiquitin-protein ligase ORTHRUS 2-like isoform X2 [Dioscorea cayenensis subsp. rotundata]
MAALDLPCDGDGVCMRCSTKTPEAEVVHCQTCTTPWHVQCLSKPPETMAAVVGWLCPDCVPPVDVAGAGGAGSVYAPSTASSQLVAAIRAIEGDASLTEAEKAKRRQKLLSGGVEMDEDDDEEEEEEEEEGEEGRKRRTRKGKEKEDAIELFDGKFKCSFCMQLPERPVTTPCGHNFCLKCFQKWVGQGKHTCAKCRTQIPSKMASQPRINLSLVAAIRMAKTAKSVVTGVSSQVYHFLRNEERPDKAFTTERAKRAGKANACSGQIFVTVPPDHFGPILAENDPKRNRGLLVGDLWEDRMECRQWGAHFPHVAGIAGQSEYGAQSVALSGGYADDEDHGEWFLYTGSGGRDLSGNKRTNKEQSFDQKFEKLNEALRVSCKKGYPVRVVRSHKEKRSSYAPEHGVRYDGIYRIEKCWRKVGIQGFKVCRYLFVRCENEPAPWTSDEHGDRPRPLPTIKELKNATDISERKESPAWDFDEKHGWKWMKPPPVSRKPVVTGNPEDTKKVKKAIRLAQNNTFRERLFKEFGCFICRKVMSSPMTTPCGHNFCKTCLLDAFSDKSYMRERTRADGRTLRAQKIVKKCPSCSVDISDFLQNPQVNRELMDLIESLKKQAEEEERAKVDDAGVDLDEECDIASNISEGGPGDEQAEEKNGCYKTTYKMKNDKATPKANKKFKCEEQVSNSKKDISGGKAAHSEMQREEFVNSKEDISVDKVTYTEKQGEEEIMNTKAEISVEKVAHNEAQSDEEVVGTKKEISVDKVSNSEKQNDLLVTSEGNKLDSPKGGIKSNAENLVKGGKPPIAVRYKRLAKRTRAAKRVTDTSDNGDESPSKILRAEPDDDFQ